MDTIKSIRSNPSFKHLFSFDENIVVSTSETKKNKPVTKNNSDKKIKDDLINDDPFFFH